MLKPILFIAAFLISTCCFSQVGVSKDSITKPAINLYKPKDTSLSDIAKTSLKVYPNPAKNKISLEVAGFDPGIITVKIIDTKGKVWRQDDRLLTNGTEEMAMFLLLNPGIYFISVFQKTKVSKKKLVIL